ncbi:MAG: hypothetical protein LUC97_10365 [Clostridiales bacterium]|nr:hypothetical protein [Clostridiales bacterium]
MKNNNFENDYAREQELYISFDKAEENEKAEIRKAHDSLWKEITAKGEDYTKLYKLYSETKERENDYIDLSDVIWDKEVKPLLDSFRKFGISKFTFSSTWSSAVETAWLFQKNGCKLEGLVEINGRHKDFMSKEYEKVHGYLFSL